MVTNRAKCKLRHCRSRLSKISFAEIVGDVKVEALANTLLHSLAVVQAKKPGDTMRNMEAEVLVDRVAEVKVIKVGQLLNDLKAASLVVTLAPLWRK